MLQRIQAQIHQVCRFRMAIQREYTALLVQLVEDRYLLPINAFAYTSYGIMEEVFESAAPKSLQLVDPAVYQGLRFDSRSSLSL